MEQLLYIQNRDWNGSLLACIAIRLAVRAEFFS